MGTSEGCLTEAQLAPGEVLPRILCVCQEDLGSLRSESCCPLISQRHTQGFVKLVREVGCSKGQSEPCPIPLPQHTELFPG